MSPINDELIKALKANTPSKENTVNLLMGIIPLGKEAAYRRLRGEIPFSLDEACMISKSLNLSLDKLLQTNSDGIYNFQLNSIDFSSPIDKLPKMMQDVCAAICHTATFDDSISYRAYRCMPFEFLFKYNSLSKIYIYILLYQLNMLPIYKDTVEIEIPDETFSLQKKMASCMQKITSILILDKHIFIDFIEIIRYLESMGIIPENDIPVLKQDLLSMIDDLERCALTGLSMHQKKMDIYISHISFDCSYSYMEGGGYRGTGISMYCINHLSCDNPEVCDNQKQWIKSLIRFSTLISVSGELQRNEYFYNQRELINEKL
ncbi:MAG: hypothetical protein LBV43_03105 [Prevotella sp.]|jgi:hypothetical protein|nr:hypothetical protein [Prevotella sp.]